MAEKNKVEKFSDRIEIFTSMCSNIKHTYNYNCNIVDQCSKKHIDYTHELELDGLRAADRSKLATKMRKNLLERRYAKDIVNVLRPMKDYLDSEEGKRAYEKLKQVLGKTRLEENNLKDRNYRPRANN